MASGTALLSGGLEGMMKKIVEIHLMVPSLLVMVTILVSCVPAAGTGAPALPLSAASNAVASDVVASSTPTATQTQTRTSTFTASPTTTQTITPTVEPSLTQPFVLLPSATRTRTRNHQNPPTVTPTFTATLELTGTETADPPTGTPCPVGTAEPLWVEPVTSPTDQLSQTIVVRIGNGEEVTVETESGTFSVTGNFNTYSNPARVDITLLPDTVHHLRVTARVATVTWSGCLYGGYTLSTTGDAQGAPLTIVQESS